MPIQSAISGLEIGSDWRREETSPAKTTIKPEMATAIFT